MADAINDLVSPEPRLPKLTAAMSQVRASVPKGYEPTSPDVMEEARGERARLLEAKRKADLEVGQAERTEKAAQDEITAATKKKIAEGYKQLPEYERMQEAERKAKELQFVPTKDNAQDLMNLFGTLGVIALIAGKGNAYGAMASLDGMYKGYAQGRADLFKQQSIEFDKKFKSLQADVQRTKDDLKQAYELYIKDAEAGDAAARVAIARAGSPLLKAQYERAGIVGALEATDTAVKSYEAAVKTRNDLYKDSLDREYKKAQLAAQQAGRYQYFKGSDGKIYQLDPFTRQTKAVEGPEGVTLEPMTGKGAVTRGGAQQQQFENITSADIGNAYFRINEYLSRAKSPEDIPTGSKFLRDKGTQSGIVEAYKNYVVNRTMPKDLQANDAALLGIAFDIAAARAFGRATGVTDAKIAQIVKQLPIEGDAPETKALKMRVLFNQLAEPNRLLAKEKQVDGSEYMMSPNAKAIFDKYSKGSAGSSRDVALQFDTEEEVDRANLPSGTRVIVGGREAKVR